ncbi:hypothetical protein NJE57_01375 [Dietzia sp. PP-33]|nr:hypothetical protein [Dietzia sp. PP-33]
MSAVHKLPHTMTVDSVPLEDVRGRVIDLRHTTGILADLRRTATDTYEVTMVLGGGDDSERVVMSGVTGTENLHLHV